MSNSLLVTLDYLSTDTALLRKSGRRAPETSSLYGIGHANACGSSDGTTCAIRFASFFEDNDVNLSVIQAALRHAKPSTTAIYTHRNNTVQLKAQAKFLEAIKVAQPAAAG